MPWRNIRQANNPVEVLNEHLSLLVGRYVPTKVIRVHNKDKPWLYDQCRHAVGLKQEAHLRWTRDRSREVRANENYSDSKRKFSDRIRAAVNVRSPHKWWPLLSLRCS